MTATTAPKITYTATSEQLEEMHQAFDQALAEVRGEFGRAYPMLIDGRERTTGASFEVRAPHDRSLLLATFPAGTKADVDDAVAAAKAAYPAWSGLPYGQRVEIIRGAASLIRERKFRLAAHGVEARETHPIPGRPRRVVHDPFGNQIEISQIAEGT